MAAPFGRRMEDEMGDHTAQTRMTLHEARKIAHDIIAGTLSVGDYLARKDDIRRAFGRLDSSDPATDAARRNDRYLARQVWRFVGQCDA